MYYVLYSVYLHKVDIDTITTKFGVDREVFWRWCRGKKRDTNTHKILGKRFLREGKNPCSTDNHRHTEHVKKMG